MGALDHLVRSGKALYVGISQYGPEDTRRAAEILRGIGTPCLIHQPKYSMFDRWIEPELVDLLAEEGMGCIPFSPLEQGMLTNKYLALEENIEQLSQVVADQSGEPVPREVLEPLLQVRPEYIAACFEEIRKRYDSKEHFFETALNLDEDKLAILRERYLHD